MILLIVFYVSDRSNLSSYLILIICPLYFSPRIAVVRNGILYIQVPEDIDTVSLVTGEATNVVIERTEDYIFSVATTLKVNRIEIDPSMITSSSQHVNIDRPITNTIEDDRTEMPTIPQSAELLNYTPGVSLSSSSTPNIARPAEARTSPMHKRPTVTVATKQMNIIQETVPVTTTSTMETYDVTMTPSGVATNVLSNVPINEEPLPFVLSENERMVGNVLHEGFVGQECGDWVSERPTMPIQTNEPQNVPTVTTAQEIIPNPNLIPLVVISDDEIPPMEDALQNMHFRPRPVHTVKEKPNRSHDAPILRTMLAEEIELQPILGDQQKVTLRERYMNRRQGILVRDLNTMQRVQRTPSVELHHINDMTAKFIRQNQKEVAFQDTHKRIKLSFPSVVGDVEHFERPKFNRLAHVDPCVRPIAIFFDTDRGYPYNNLPSGLNLSQRDYSARG